MTTKSNPAENIKKLAGFIDMTPTWEEILPTLLAVHTDGNATGRAHAFGELTRMAKLADAYVAAERAKRRPDDEAIEWFVEVMVDRHQEVYGKDIAKRVGLSAARVNQLIQRAAKKLVDMPDHRAHVYAKSFIACGGLHGNRMDYREDLKRLKAGLPPLYP